jgi:hypothetical protein
MGSKHLFVTLRTKGIRVNIGFKNNVALITDWIHHKVIFHVESCEDSLKGTQHRRCRVNEPTNQTRNNECHANDDEGSGAKGDTVVRVKKRDHIQNAAHVPLRVKVITGRDNSAWQIGHCDDMVRRNGSVTGCGGLK